MANSLRTQWLEKLKHRYKPVEPPPWVSASQWEDWKWQLRFSLRYQEDFAKYFNLTVGEIRAFQEGSQLFQIRTTPYYASLVKPDSPKDPIRQILVPQSQELLEGRQQMLDPLGELRHNPAPRIIHRYPDRLLFLVTDMCTVYCRYCTRKHFTGGEKVFPSSHEYDQALNYIREHKEVREVILSGGDPLSLSDARLVKVLRDVRSIDHVDLIRVGTRVPVVAPMRITNDLIDQLQEFSPLFFMTHFNHPREVTLEAAMALSRLVENGFPVMNQMVLLNGVNNHPAHVAALSRRLLFLRVKPYYMFQCDPSEGSDHLRTSVEDSLEIQKSLWGRLSGLALPHLSLDIPGGGGKVGLVPEFMVEKSGHKRRYRGWDGYESTYVSPPPESIQKPQDVSEWESYL